MDFEANSGSTPANTTAVVGNAKGTGAGVLGATGVGLGGFSSNLTGG